MFSLASPSSLEFTSSMSKVVVQPSLIHGRGVFAARRIELAEVIIDGCRLMLECN
jgi:SET domain-containing protein